MSPHRIVGCALLSGMVLGVGLAGAATPPKNLHWVEDHWTAWQPPTEFPAGTEIYRIERGDTLWDLAGRFLGDPYLWPQIWDLNRYIEDAHWIYPGDPLAIRTDVIPVEELADWGVGDGDAVAGRGDAGFADFAGEPVALGSESDIVCSGYIGDANEEFPRHLIGSEYESLMPKLHPGAQRGRALARYGEAIKTRLSNGDIVYVDGGATAGMSAGQVFTVVEPRELVEHPIDGHVVGRHYAYNGRVRVLAVHDGSATAEIISACRPIVVGSALKQIPEEPIPLGRRLPMRPVNDPPSPEELADAPVVLYSDARLVSLGVGHLVYIDRGTVDDVAPGDLYTVYRHNRQTGLPPVVLGEVAVLSVQPHASLARILESRYPVYIGDPLEAR